MISKFRPAYLLLSHLYSPFSNPTLFPAMVKLPSASRIRSLAAVPSTATRAFATVNPTPPAAQPTKLGGAHMKATLQDRIDWWLEEGQEE